MFSRITQALKSKLMTREVIQDNSTFNREIYTEQIKQVLNPLIESNSKTNCDKLVYFHILKQVPNTHTSADKTTKYHDLLPNGFTVPSEIDLTKTSLKSAISNIALNNLRKKLSLEFNPRIFCNFPDGDIDNGYGITMHTDYGNRDKLSVMAKKTNTIKFNECFSESNRVEIIIGFIDIYNTDTAKKFGGVNHKNCLILDLKNKYIIRFEPKYRDPPLSSSYRYPINEQIIRDYINKLFPKSSTNNINEFSYLEIRGNQSNISLSDDYVYCAIYSLYCGLLFIKNYNKFKIKYETLTGDFSLEGRKKKNKKKKSNKKKKKKSNKKKKKRGSQKCVKNKN
jgi:hypothetical protein